MQALILNCSLKSSPEESSTDELAQYACNQFTAVNVDCEIVRVVDHNILPGVSSDEGEGDEWPAIRELILTADILIMASPTWVGKPSSLAQRVIERMDGMLSETDVQGRPVAYNHVAGCIATGNEDGAKHVISEMTSSLVEIGFTVPGQSWTYYNQGSPMGPSYLENQNAEDKKRTHENASLAVHNLVAVAESLARHPIPPR